MKPIDETDDWKKSHEWWNDYEYEISKVSIENDAIKIKIREDKYFIIEKKDLDTPLALLATLQGLYKAHWINEAIFHATCLCICTMLGGYDSQNG